MSITSAGILFYKYHHTILHVLLVHPGGPFWAKKEDGAWTIPKGEINAGEQPVEAAKRETTEETGISLHNEILIPLSPVKQKAGKIIYAWACKKEIVSADIVSNNFDMEWPPKSGRKQSFPEIDKAGWFTVAEAKTKINSGQSPLIDELCALLAQQSNQLH